MRLWASVDLGTLPDIFQNGLIDYSHQGISFHNEPELVAEYALEATGELAFLEGEFPDNELDGWFTLCMEAWSADMTDLEVGLARKQEDLVELIDMDPENPEIPSRQEDIDVHAEYLQKVANLSTGSESLEVLGSACIWRTVPITMLKLLNPETMMEAVWTKDLGAIAEAVETTESYGLETLGSSFWVWLMFLFQNIFAAGARKPMTWSEVEAERAAEKGEERKARKKKRAKKSRTKGRKKVTS